MREAVDTGKADTVQGAQPTWHASKHTASTFACCFAAGMLNMLELLLFNGELYGTYENLVGWSRDASTLIETAALLGLLLVAHWCPRRNHPVSPTVLAAALALAGYALCATGVLTNAAWPIVVGVALVALSSAWGIVLWLLACSTLGMRLGSLCLAGSGVFAIPVAFSVNTALSYVALNAIGLVCTAGMPLLCLAPTLPFFKRLAAVGVPAEQAVAQPGAFLPLGHTFYVYIFVFSLAYGFALRCENITGSHTVSGMTFLATLAATAYAWRVRDRLRVDTLFVASLFAVSVGFMLMLLDDARTEAIASSLLVAGYMWSQLLVWIALCSAAARTTADAIPTICWGTAVGYVGICCGVLLWMIPNRLLATVLQGDGLAQGLIVTAVLAGLVLYAILTRRSFSFDATIGGIEPDAPPVAVRYTSLLDERCNDAAARMHLTAREAEVARLLARGNNASRIQKELGISYNTVKYHVKNVYTKLGVHSQQELIDRLAEPDPAR